MIVAAILLAIVVSVVVDSDRRGKAEAQPASTTATRAQRRRWARERADLNPSLRRRRRSTP